MLCVCALLWHFRVLISVGASYLVVPRSLDYARVTIRGMKRRTDSHALPLLSRKYSTSSSRSASSLPPLSFSILLGESACDWLWWPLGVSVRPFLLDLHSSIAIATALDASYRLFRASYPSMDWTFQPLNFWMRLARKGTELVRLLVCWIREKDTKSLQSTLVPFG